MSRLPNSQPFSRSFVVLLSSVVQQPALSELRLVRFSFPVLMELVSRFFTAMLERYCRRLYLYLFPSRSGSASTRQSAEIHSIVPLQFAFTFLGIMSLSSLFAVESANFL